MIAQFFSNRTTIQYAKLRAETANLPRLGLHPHSIFASYERTFSYAQ